MRMLNNLHTINNEMLTYRQAVEKLTSERITLIDKELQLLDDISPVTEAANRTRDVSVLVLGIERDHLVDILDLLNRI